MHRDPEPATLINPETCGAGDCEACDGPPCEHGCHLEVLW